MKLLNKKLLKRFAEIGSDILPNPLVIARYYHTLNGWEWYATHYFPESETFYGWIAGADDSMGYFGIDELEDMLVWGMPVCLDPDWREKRLDEVKAYNEA